MKTNQLLIRTPNTHRLVSAINSIKNSKNTRLPLSVQLNILNIKILWTL